MVTVKDGSYPSADGSTTIFYRMYIPDRPISGVIQICHGLSESITRYDRFMRYLAANNYLVAGNDHFLHGKSLSAPDKNGCWDNKFSWDVALGDIQTLHDIVSNIYSDIPYFYFGHSMGSFLLTSYLIRFSDICSGAILSGTGQWPKISLNIANRLIPDDVRTSWKRPNILKKYVENAKQKTLNGGTSFFNRLSRNPYEVAEYLSEPDCGIVPSNGLIYAMLNGLRFNADQHHTARISKNIPILLISGSNDPVGRCGKGTFLSYKNLLQSGIVNISLHLYPDAGHELLHEINYETVSSDILSWLNIYSDLNTAH